MNKNYDFFKIQSSNEKQSRDIPTPEDLLNTGLTDDERVIREDESLGDEARVEPGPADMERVRKP